MALPSIRKVMCRSIEPGRLRTIVKATASALALLVTLACMGIKPPVFQRRGASSPWADCHWSTTTEQNGIAVKAHAFLSTEDNLQHFDLDFPRLGILPVLIQIDSGKTGTFSWNTKSFSMKRNGRSSPPLPFAKVEKAAFRHYGIKMYSDKEINDFRQNFAAWIVQKGALPPNDQFTGLLFFPLSGLAAADTVLIDVTGKNDLGQPVNLQVVLPAK